MSLAENQLNKSPLLRLTHFKELSMALSLNASVLRVFCESIYKCLSDKFF